MSTSMYGADVAALRALAQDLALGADSLREAAARIGSTLATGAAWEGPVADRFRSDWSGAHRNAVLSASVLLLDAGAALRRNADDQERTSAATSGGGVGTGGSGAGAGAGASGAGATTAAGLGPHDFLDLTPTEQEDWLAGASDQEVADLYAGLVGSGVEEDSLGYADVLREHWTRVAAGNAGFDFRDWDPSAGAGANREIIEGVYEYYGQLYLDNPWMQWAGMANMIGPSFAAGFFDLDMMRGLAQGVADLPPGFPVPGGDRGAFQDLAQMSDDELAFYEKSFLSMQREIFVDQAVMHEAYLSGGLPEMERMLESGLIDSRAYAAWENIEAGRAGDSAALAAGNTSLLWREQNQVIADDWGAMQDRPGTGQAFTYLMTLVGEPSIPGAGTYAQHDPLTVRTETHGPERIGVPFTSWSFDNPLQAEITVETPLPGGNIADQGTRWAYISKDTLPAYQRFLAEDPQGAADLVGSSVPDRIADYRLTNLGRIDRIVDRLGEWDVDVKQ